jgi:hypothetical protein
MKPLPLGSKHKFFYLANGNYLLAEGLHLGTVADEWVFGWPVNAKFVFCLPRSYGQSSENKWFEPKIRSSK